MGAREQPHRERMKEVGMCVRYFFIGPRDNCGRVDGWSCGPCGTRIVHTIEHTHARAHKYTHRKRKGEHPPVVCVCGGPQKVRKTDKDKRAPIKHTHTYIRMCIHNGGLYTERRRMATLVEQSYLSQLLIPLPHTQFDSVSVALLVTVSGKWKVQ